MPDDHTDPDVMELDQSLVDEFVKEVKAELAKTSELVLLPCGTARAWTTSYMLRPTDMDPSEFSEYVDAVSAELVASGVLKPDNRKHRGLTAHRPGRMRVSQSWWRKAHANSSS